MFAFITRVDVRKRLRKTLLKQKHGDRRKNRSKTVSRLVLNFTKKISQKLSQPKTPRARDDSTCNLLTINAYDNSNVSMRARSIRAHASLFSVLLTVDKVHNLAAVRGHSKLRDLST